jgi:hypothetical protein
MPIFELPIISKILINSKIMKKTIFFLFFVILYQSNFAKSATSDNYFDIDYPNNPTQKFCSYTATGKYEITLINDGTYTVYFKLYNSVGNVQKTMQGIWEISDKSNYGAESILDIRWTGLNSNMPNLKYRCQYGANNKLQAIIDGQNRTWQKCN